VLLVILMFTLVALAIQLPPVQTVLVKRVSVELSQKLGFKVQLKNIYINWFNIIYIKGLSVTDKFGTPMIVADKLNIRFKLKNLLVRNIKVEGASIDGGEVHLVVHKEDENLNITEFIEKIQELTNDGDTTRSPNPVAFVISRVNLRNYSFRYTDQTADSIHDAFDYYHFHLGNLNISADRLRSRRDTFEVNIINSNALESKSRIPIHTLKGFYRYTKHDMFLENMDVKVGSSHLKNYFRFEYKTTADFKKFNSNVRMKANLDSSVIYTDDVAWFAPTLKPMKDIWTLSGRFDGTVNHFDVKNLRAFTLAGSKLRGNLSMTGLPDVDNTFMWIDMKKASFQPRDIAYWAGEEAELYLNRLGSINTSSNFTGFTHDFVIKGLFETQLGNLDSYLHLIFPKNQPPTYKGHVISSGFGLGGLLGDHSAIQNMAIDAELDGTGFEPERARLKFQGKIPYIEYQGKPIRNIEADIFYHSLKWSGKLASNDTNLHVKFQGFGDLSAKNRFGVVNGQAYNINLKHFGFSEKPANFKFELDADVQNLNPAEAKGYVIVKNFQGSIGDKVLKADVISGRSTFEDGHVNFFFNSDFFDFKLEGNFDYLNVINDLKVFGLQHVLLINNQTVLQEKLYNKAKHKKTDKEYQVDFTLVENNVQPLLDFLSLPIELKLKKPIEGSFLNNHGNYVAELTTEISQIALGDYRFMNNNLDVVSSVSKTNSQVLSSVEFYSDEQNAPGFPPTKNLSTVVQWMNQKLNFNLILNQKSRDNKGILAGSVSFLPQEVMVELLPTKFRLLNQDWELGKDIQLHIYPNQNMLLERFLVSSGEQKIEASGPITNDSDDKFNVKCIQLESAIFKPFIGIELHGKLDAYIQITKALTDPFLQGKVDADSLFLGKVLIGELHANSDFIPATNRLSIEGNISRDKQVVVNANGFVDLSREKGLKIDMKLNNARFQLLEPFLLDLASDLKGVVRGNVSLFGTLNDPKLNGNLYIQGGSFKVDLLNTVYTFSDSAKITDRYIDVSGVRLFDEDRNKAVLTKARLNHKFFRDFYLDVQGSYKQFKVLNTTLKDNNLYFGTAIVTGTTEIIGPFNDLLLRANAKTNAGTKIYLPFGETDAVRATEDYITFKKKESQTSISLDTIKKVSVSGIKLDFNIDVTEDAYGEIILDQTTGDIIKAVGSGKMKMTFDSKGEFKLLGEYVIKRGQYTFTSFNIFNKNFEISPGSTIVWSGDPFDGQTDIVARYSLSTSLAPLVPVLGNEDLLQRPEIRRRYPVDVKMILKGALLTPDITLGIDIIDYPKNSILATYVTNFQTRVQTDEQELNRQVFSLLVLRSFMGENAVQGNIQPANSLSELLSNQLSNWLSKVDENLDISVDLSGLSQSSVNSFNVRFSYTLLKGRLRITRDGSINNTQNQSTASAIAGDWTIEYMLTSDGKFRAKMFHRNNLNVTNSLNTNNTSQGASIMHTQSFNSVKELFERKRNRKAKKEQKPQADAALNKDESQNLNNQ